MKCARCNKSFTCGCQKTKAPDGSIVHKSCLRKTSTKATHVARPVNNKPGNIRKNERINKYDRARRINH